MGGWVWFSWRVALNMYVILNFRSKLPHLNYLLIWKYTDTPYKVNPGPLYTADVCLSQISLATSVFFTPLFFSLVPYLSYFVLCLILFFCFLPSSLWSTAGPSQRTARRSWPSSRQSTPRPARTSCHQWSWGTLWDDVWLALRPTALKHLSTSMNCVLCSSSMPSRRGKPSSRLTLGLLPQRRVIFSLPPSHSKVQARVKVTWTRRKKACSRQQMKSSLPPQDSKRTERQTEKRREKPKEPPGSRLVWIRCCYSMNLGIIIKVLFVYCILYIYSFICTAQFVSVFLIWLQYSHFKREKE